MRWRASGLTTRLVAVGEAARAVFVLFTAAVGAAVLVAVRVVSLAAESIPLPQARRLH